MIYGMHLYNYEPPVKIDIDLSESQCVALRESEAGTYPTMERVALDALRTAGLTSAEQLHVSTFMETVTESNSGSTVEEVEARLKGKRDPFTNPRSEGAKVVIPVLEPIILRAQKQRYWREIALSGDPVL